MAEFYMTFARTKYFSRFFFGGGEGEQMTAYERLSTSERTIQNNVLQCMHFADGATGNPGSVVIKGPA